MQQYRTFWLLLTMMLVGGFTLTSCVDNKDDANEGGSGDNYKNYVERMYPVVDPQNSPQGMVMLRFYDDMPSVAYVSIPAWLTSASATSRASCIPARRCRW